MARGGDTGAGGGTGDETREDRIAGLRLIRTPTVGPVTYCQLLARYGSAAVALEAVPDLARRDGGKPPVLPSRAAIVQTVLLELDLAGRLERHAGGQVSLAF